MKILTLESSITQNLGFKMVRPEDIIQGEFVTINSEDISKIEPIPYCIDFEKSMLISAFDVDVLDAAKATFQYDYLRKKSKKFLYLPFQALQKQPPVINFSPFLLFSPGRCGSTLISKLIEKMGIVSISEPDIYSQVAMYFATQKKTVDQVKIAHHILKWVNYFQFRPFAERDASKVLIKFRSHVNHAPSIVMSSFPKNVKTIFLTRDFHSWCKSRMRVFANSIEHNLEIYTRSLLCLRFLLKNSNCLVINYNDLERNPNVIVSRLSKFFDKPVDFDDLNDIFQQDSQADTKLARDRVKKNLTDSEIESINKIWLQKAPHILLEELGVNLYSLD